jgi:hypothetical protein
MNKKTLLLVAIITATFAKTFALDISEKRNLFGFNAGLGVSTISVEKDSFNAVKNRAKLGTEVGFTFEHRFKRVVAFQTGLNYTYKGAKVNLQKSAVVNSGYYQVDFHSLELPLIVKFYMGKKKRFNLNVGGYASYALSVNSRAKIDFVTNPFLSDVDEKKKNILKDQSKDGNGNVYFQPFDAGLKLGFEFLSIKGFGVGANISQGFIDFTNSKYNTLVVPNNTTLFLFLHDTDRKVLHTAVNVYAIFKF